MSRQSKQAGFTLLELVVVLAIMGLLATVTVLAFNAQRGGRNLRIAQNELATNWKKTQSAVLSARDLPDGATTVPAKFYGVEIATGQAQYKTFGIGQAWQVIGRATGLEPLRFPEGVLAQRMTVVDLKQPTVVREVSCVVVLFGAPFGRAQVVTSATGACPTDEQVVVAGQDPAQQLVGNEQAVCVELGYGTEPRRSVTLYGPTATAVAQNTSCPAS
jgi:prepilin-type N-terminal cleavage/methylation domain-containing protein